MCAEEQKSKNKIFVCTSRTPVDGSDENVCLTLTDRISLFRFCDTHTHTHNSYLALDLFYTRILVKHLASHDGLVG